MSSMNVAFRRIRRETYIKVTQQLMITFLNFVVFRYELVKPG